MSQSYIPDRTVDKIDKVGALMVESGLFQFYISFKKYEEKREQMAHVQKKPNHFLAELTLVDIFISQFRSIATDEERNEFFEVYAGYVDTDEKDIDPFTMKHLKRPVLVVLYLYAIATIVFLAECIVHKWSGWRDRESYHKLMCE